MVDYALGARTKIVLESTIDATIKLMRPEEIVEVAWTARGTYGMTKEFQEEADELPEN